MPKLIVKSLDEVAEPLREFYRQTDDGRFVFQAEDIKDHPDVLGLKNNLFKAIGEKKTAETEAKTLQEKLAELGDLDEVKKVLEEHQKTRDKKLIDAGKVDELVEQRTSKLKGDLEKQIKALSGERDTLHGKLSEVLIDSALKDVAVKAKVRPTALEDVLLRGKQIWRLKDNQPVALKGDEAIFGKEGKPISMLEWVNELQTAAPHLFEGSSGGGAGGSNTTNNGSGGVKLFRADAPNAIGENLEAFASGNARLTN